MDGLEENGVASLFNTVECRKPNARNLENAKIRMNIFGFQTVLSQPRLLKSELGQSGR